MAECIIRLLSLPVLALVVLAGCGGTGDGTVPTPTSTPAGGAASPAAEANTVDVALTEYAIEMPALPPGPTVFVVTNNGTIEHNFEVEGQGMEQGFEENLMPGETKRLEVNLQSGTYEVYCPVENHKALGMDVKLTVGE